MPDALPDEPQPAEIPEFDKSDEFQEIVKPQLEVVAKLLSEHQIPFLLGGTVTMVKHPDQPGLMKTDVFTVHDGILGAGQKTWQLCLLIAHCSAEVEVGYVAGEFLREHPDALSGLLYSLQKAGILHDPADRKSAPSVH